MTIGKNRFYIDEEIQAAKFKSECLKITEWVKKQETFLLLN